MKKTRRATEQIIRILGEADTGPSGGGHLPNVRVWDGQNVYNRDFKVAFYGCIFFKEFHQIYKNR